MKEWEGTAYPKMLRDLPEIDVPLKGVRGWLLQSKDKQVAFFDIEPVGKVPPHSHCAQWGLVVEGEMSLTIGEKTRVYRKILADLFVAAKIRFYAKEEGLDLDDENELFKKWEKKDRKNRNAHMRDLDNTIEEELKEKISEPTEKPKK